MEKIRKDIEQNSNPDNVESMDKRINDYRYTLNSINSWIISADNKVSIYCGMYSVVIAVITFVANHVMSGICTPLAVSNQSVNNQYAYNWFVAFVVSALVSFLASIVFYTKAVKPNLIGEKQCIDSKQKFTLFYKDIAGFESAEIFVNAAIEVDRESYFKEILAEVYYNSKVCTKKMQNFQIAVVLSTISVFMTVGACVAYYYYCN